MKIIGYCAHAVVWDGRGFYRRDPKGKRLVVFSDTSPFPDHDGEMYGVALEAGFDPDGCPWTSDSLVEAFEFGNGRFVPGVEATP